MDSPVATTMGKGSTEIESRLAGSADPSEKKESNLFCKNRLILLTTESILQLVNLDVPGRSQSDTGKSKEELHCVVRRVW
jgi:hypothetical protein